MTFQWKGQTIGNYGETGAALCALETPEEAAEFWDAYVAYLRRPEADLAGATPEAVAGSNIGYLMGYYGAEERQRVYDLFSAFNVSHPIFGRVEPTPGAAVEAGKRAVYGEFA